MPEEARQASSIPLQVHLGDKDISQLIMSTPLFSQLSEIERLLQGQFPQGGAGASTAAGVSMDTTTLGQPYIDVNDAQWECRGELVLVDIHTLQPADFVVYRFGVFFMQLIRSPSQLPDVTLLLASNLLPNNYLRNAFRNSFFYEHSRKILFVRRERMESVGEFIMVIIGCLAHANAGDFSSSGISTRCVMTSWTNVDAVGLCE